MAFMNIDEIIKQRTQLNHDLQIALATMERKDTIGKIRSAMLENQNKCPHISDKYNWVMQDGVCPYCGKQLYGGQEEE